MRVDWLGLFTTYLGIFFFFSAQSKVWKSYLAVLFFLLAFYTKQTFLSAPLACFLVLLVIAPRRAFRLALLGVAFGGAAFWLGAHWTHGGLVQHLITYNMNKFSLKRALTGVSSSLDDVIPFLIPFGGLLALAFYRARDIPSSHLWVSWKARLQRNPFSLALCVGILHWAFAFLFSFAYGKVGTTVNYFLEPDAALCVLSGLFLGVLFWQAKGAPRLTAILAAALVIPVGLAGYSLYTILNSAVGSAEIRAADRDRTTAYRQLIPILAATPGPVLCDDMVLLNRAGKDLVFEPATLGFMADSALGIRRDLNTASLPKSSP